MIYMVYQCSSIQHIVVLLKITEKLKNMNKILSQALKKAVSEYSPNNSELSKTKDLIYSHLIMTLNFFKMKKASLLKLIDQEMLN